MEVWQAGQMMLEASGEVANTISNGTFQFTVGNIESGEEIGYKGLTTLKATQGQIDGFFSQLPYECHQNRVASVGD